MNLPRLPSKRKFKYYTALWFRHDLAAGFSVFLVALPLCLGIALASGAPLYAGILSGIIGGLVVSLVSGSHLSVSGPAAGLTTVVSAAIVSFGDYRIFLLSVIIAGLFQIILGMLKLGTVANYFPSAVIKGMLAAIGIILITKQLPLMLGFDKPDFWTSEFLQLFSPKNFLGNISGFIHHLTFAAILISLVSMFILISWQHPLLRRFRVIPASLIVVALGIIIAAILSATTNNFELRPGQLVSIPYNIFGNMVFPDLSRLFSDTDVIVNGLLIGMLASLESLLCIEAIDKMDPQHRNTPINRELIAQGVGNTLCGLLGAIPLTAVIVRGAANISAGAKSRMSAFTHGIFLLLAVLFIPFILNLIPYAALAAILLVVGFNLTHPSLYRHIFRLGPNQFLPFVITIVTILVTDLLVGVTIGLLFSVYFIIQNNFKAQYRLRKEIHNGIENYYLKLNTNVTFLNKVRLRETLNRIPEYSVLTLDGSECNFIDYDVLEVISEYERKCRERHIELHLLGIERVEVMAAH